MKANLKDILAMAALCLAMFSNAVPTLAGLAITPGVSIGIDGDYQYAKGSMTGARYSADSKQHIGCSVSSYLYGSLFVECSARDSTGRRLHCQSDTLSGARFLSLVQGMTDSSEVYFSQRNNGNTHGYCEVIAIANSSERLR